MRVVNRHRVSYPGYNEMLTGFADPRIRSNAAIENPNQTVFEYLGTQSAFTKRIQVFATWGTFFSIFATHRSHLDVRAGLRPPFDGAPDRTPEKDLIDSLYHASTPLFGDNALDSMTYAALKISLRENQPRLLFVGLGETDEWMHHGRYDLMLTSLQRADEMVRDLWQTLEALPQYAGKTVYIITTDHGRGLLPWDWRHHGEPVIGSDEVWLGIMGPTVPALGIRENTPTQLAQVAGTIAALLQAEWTTKEPRAASPLPLWPVSLATSILRD
jgi:hypothetical protein